MSSKHFTTLCSTEKIAVPSTDKDVRAFLTNAGATFGGKSGAPSCAIRLESAAAVAWSRTHLDEDDKWVAIPPHAAKLLQSLFPIKASIAQLGGDKWTPAVRALIRAQLTPVASPVKATAATGPATGTRLGSKHVAKSLNAALNAAAPTRAAPASAAPLPVAAAAPAPPAPPALPAAAAAQPTAAATAAAALPEPKGNQPSISASQAYQSSSALEAILSPLRLTQLYLGESWTLEKRANRDKQMTRVRSSAHFETRFEDPADPLWAQRIAFRRGAGSALTPEAVNQDGKNLALALRWESVEAYTTAGEWAAMQQMRDRATRVGTAWDRFSEAIDLQQGVPQSVIRPILMAIKEVLALRVREAAIEVGLLGPAGQEIVDDMRRQQTEVATLFTTYDQILAAQMAGIMSLQDMARRTNGVWWALLEPSVKLLCPDRTFAPEKDALVSQAEGACAARPGSKRPKTAVAPLAPSPLTTPMPPPTIAVPQHIFSPWSWPPPAETPGTTTLPTPPAKDTTQSSEEEPDDEEYHHFSPAPAQAAAPSAPAQTMDVAYPAAAAAATAAARSDAPPFVVLYPWNLFGPRP